MRPSCITSYSAGANERSNEKMRRCVSPYLTIGQKAPPGLVGKFDSLGAAVGKLIGTGFFRIEMILSWFAGDQFTGFRYL